MAPKVRGGYKARPEVSLYIHEPPADRRFFAVADAGVALTGGTGASPAGRSAAAAVAEPAARVRLGEEVSVEKQYRVEVRSRDDDRVVAVIELLSPTNKSEELARLQFLAKRKRLVESGVHFLQIDLLRGGRRLLPVGADPGGAHYNALLARGGEAEADVYYWSLRDRLPTLPVPLSPPDPDAALNLQAVLDGVYDALAYGQDLYRHPPDPPLGEEDAAWASPLIGATA